MLTFIQVYVANYGSAPANNIDVRLQFPEALVAQSDRELVQRKISKPLRDDVRDYIELSDMVDSFGYRWASVFNRNLELLPWQELWLIGQGWFYVRAGPARMLWQIRCRQGDFPGGNLDATLEILFN